MSILSNWFEFLALGCRDLEAPAAVPIKVTLSAAVNLIDGGFGTGSVIASGTVEANRVTWVRNQDGLDLAPNTFAMVHDECGCPGPSELLANTPTVNNGFFEGGLATGPATVTNPIADDPGLIELYLAGVTSIALSGSIQIGSQIYRSGFVGPIADHVPSTWEEMIGVYEVIQTTAPGSDPAGTITWTFEVS